MTTAIGPTVLGQQTCSSLAESSRREWLVPDGTGSFAMGTVGGLRTRRYHGLLVPAVQPPLGRMLALASLDPTVVLPDGERVPLGVHEWAGGVVAPVGHTRLVRFDLEDGLPRWRWQIGDVVLERELAMQHGRPAMAVVHRLLAGGLVRLELEALTTWRDAHGERRAWGEPDQQDAADGAVLEHAYRLRGPGWMPVRQWYLGVRHRLEAERGLAAEEDLWCAGRFVANLRPGAAVAVTAWAGSLAELPPAPTGLVAAARSRARSLVRAATAASGNGAGGADLPEQLVLAADAFVVARPDPAAGGGVTPDVVAGYPWFGAWTRDTMTAYEGLFLSTGRAAEGRELLLGYARTVDRGMLANTADTGSTEYNTADGTLWFVHAAGRHVERTGDTELARTLLPVLDEVVAAHVAGTRYGIRVDSDGLLRQGEPGYALTWMDARVDGIGVTARIGKPVEVNALWVRALEVTAGFRRLAARPHDDLDDAAAAARTAFRQRFPAPGGWLHDVVDGPDGDDCGLRPNQLLALSLPGEPLVDDAIAASVLDVTGRALRTPFGLRSLAPDDPAYRGAHRGGPAERDAAYHQGTVWPWLLGPYVDACRRYGRSVDDVLAGALEHLADWGLGSVSETADGDAPHAGTGCPFQAWSVAELLRVTQDGAGSADRPRIAVKRTAGSPDEAGTRATERG